MQLCCNVKQNVTHNLLITYFGPGLHPWHLKPSGFSIMGLLPALRNVVFDHYVYCSPVASPETRNVVYCPSSSNCVSVGDISWWFKDIPTDWCYIRIPCGSSWCSWPPYFPHAWEFQQDFTWSWQSEEESGIIVYSSVQLWVTKI